MAKLSDLVTENDGKSLCPLRVIGWIGVLHFFVMTDIDYVRSGVFNGVTFATSLAALFTALGVVFAVKSFQEGKTDQAGSQT